MTTKSEVKKFLTDCPRLADDRNGLLAAYFSNKYDIDLHIIEAIATHFREASNVDRYFRMVQQENPNLRGKEYKRRHEVLEPEKLKELGYVTFKTGCKIA